MTSHDTHAESAANARDGATPETPSPTVTVHPHGELTTYFGRVSRVRAPITPGMTITALLEQLAVPAKEVWVVALNGETVQPDATLSDGDSVELFSPVAGG